MKSVDTGGAPPRRSRVRKVILALAIWAALALGVRLVISVLAAGYPPSTGNFNAT